MASAWFVTSGDASHPATATSRSCACESPPRRAASRWEVSISGRSVNVAGEREVGGVRQRAILGTILNVAGERGGAARQPSWARSKNLATSRLCAPRITNHRCINLLYPPSGEATRLVARRGAVPRREWRGGAAPVPGNRRLWLVGPPADRPRRAREAAGGVLGGAAAALVEGGGGELDGRGRLGGDGGDAGGGLGGGGDGDARRGVGDARGLRELLAERGRHAQAALHVLGLRQRLLLRLLAGRGEAGGAQARAARLARRAQRDLEHGRAEELVDDDGRDQRAVQRGAPPREEPRDLVGEAEAHARLRHVARPAIRAVDARRGGAMATERAAAVERGEARAYEQQRGGPRAAQLRDAHRASGRDEEEAEHGRHGAAQQRGEGAPLPPPVAHERARREACEHGLEPQHALQAAAAHGTLHERLEGEGVASEQQQRQLAHREPSCERREGHPQQQQAADAEHCGVRHREEELQHRAADEVRQRGERVGLALVEHRLA
eukprot:scaffold125943_cov60-Phaeocystis_antarctica.AAC.3